jgi:KUP system potassium uptake protein
VVIEKFLSNENELPFYEKVVMKIYFLLKYLSLSEEKAFGLDTSNVLIEKFPMVIAPAKELNMKRVK